MQKQKNHMQSSCMKAMSSARSPYSSRSQLALRRRSVYPLIPYPVLFHAELLADLLV